MRISVISNNQFKTINNNNRHNNNIPFNGLTEINTTLRKQISPLMALLGTTALVCSYLMGLTQKRETINEIGNFINSDNYNKDSLKVKDFTNDGVLDFELVDKEGKKVIYDAEKNKLLEYATTLQDIKE